ncbi:TIGR01621 family pseudouridine synthase [Aliikangiella coralliicola]|uniref:TIGR01621 family pseudouridine synthase n=1 Tax=Aliikangiella coralliicola TaxID=2592383 RepID=A0A545TW88_9GAMM|nr:TIGR01621 family pseudouridine synthase [Aliikangiella coralliicola]TQV81475.1 TIGR01621 family pseudouridine synthase [Aliikangiella coralliicola]
MIDINIVYKNPDFLIVSKPANISIQDNDDNIGFFNQLKRQLETELWPVHRLDQMTSGLLILAKNKTSANHFGQLFGQRKIDKVYIALSDKKPKKKQGKIKGDMQKSRDGSWKLSQSLNNPALTQFYTRSLLPGQRFFWVKPQTGKTHQIRVALKSLGAPILGDQRYGGTQSDRGYLHAYQLSFTWKGELINCRCAPDTGQFYLVPELNDCIDYFDQLF